MNRFGTFRHNRPERAESAVFCARSHPPSAAWRGFGWFMPGLILLVSLLLGGCGFVASESKLAGTWQVDLPTPQKIVYTFQPNHTYTMKLAPRAGAILGTWKLDGNLLTMTLGSFAADGITNPMPVMKGLSTQKNMITKLTGSSMTWRTGAIGGALKFKRLPSSPSTRQ